MQRRPFLTCATALACGLLLSTAARAQTTINVAALADFAGPYANVMNDMQGGRLAVIDWWNKEVGEKLKVRIAVKTYDTRYDVAQTASLWPGIKAELKPVMVLGLGAARCRRFAAAAAGRQGADAVRHRGLRLRLEARPVGAQHPPDLSARGGRLPGVVPQRPSSTASAR